MALYIDDEQINAQKLFERLMISDGKFQRIIKKPVFQLDESRILKKRTVNSPLAKKTTYGIITHFWFKDSDGLMKRLRYAENQIRKVENGVTRFEYKPERLNVDGTTVNFLKAADKAAFMFLNPGNPTSPFADPLRKKFAYMDTIEATKKAADDISSIQKALNHASNMEEEELVIVAKGLKLLHSDDYNIDELRVQLQQYAINPQTNRRYVQAMNDDMVRIEGRIRNLVDKKLITLEKKGSTRQWVWADGARKGEWIGETIMNPNEDALQRLINFIKANLDIYLNDLRNSDMAFEADRKGREVLKKAKEEEVQVPAHLAAVNAPAPALKDTLTSFALCRDYVGARNYPKTAVLIKEFETAVKEEVVTNDNVDDFLSALFAK